MSNSSSPLLEGWQRTLLGLYLYLVLIPLMYLLVTLWPAATSSEAVSLPSIPVFRLILELTREQAMLWAVAVVGALGGSLHAAASFSVYTGNRALKSSWVWWYLARWPIGAGLALVFYMVMRAGLLNATGSNNPLDALNPYGVATVAALVGLFSEVAMRKLREVFETLFRPAPSKDPVTAASPRLARVDPSKLAAGSADSVVSVIGTDFEDGDVVTLDGVALQTRFVSASELQATLPQDKLTQARELTLVVPRGGPAGAASAAIKVTVG